VLGNGELACHQWCGPRVVHICPFKRPSSYRMLSLSPLFVLFLPVGEVDAHGVVGGAKTGKVRVKGSGAFVFFLAFFIRVFMLMALILILLEPFATSSSSLHIRPLQLGSCHRLPCRDTQAARRLRGQRPALNSRCGFLEFFY
jgi:hypothetical protein